MRKILRSTALGLVLVSLTVVPSWSAEPPEKVPAYPEGQEPMNEGDIRLLLSGKTFDFRVYKQNLTPGDYLAGLEYLARSDLPDAEGEGALTGTSIWDFGAGTVSGSYTVGKSPPQTYRADWFIQNGVNCTRVSGHSAVCREIFPYREGFMEVTAEGSVYAVHLPRE